MAKRNTITQDEINLRKKPINEFTCCGKTMEHKDFMAHLENEHKVNVKGLKAKKQMLMHMDGDYWYSYNWQWELESGLKFTQYTMTAREKNDPMRYDY